MFVLLFTYTWGGAIRPPGVAHYIDYVLPGNFVLAHRLRLAPCLRQDQPDHLTVDALRALCLGGPTATHVWQALAVLGGLLIITVPAAVLRYRRTTAT